LPGDWQIFPEQVCPFVAAAVGAAAIAAAAAPAANSGAM
jgi:hypothetical protein